ncbi:hypothetical protein F-VV57_0225 [Faustovirus]|nr:hypothetical protein F-VV57_0225 [Faustovirus]QJX73493.1 zinc-ribbon domain protein [Faustovirus]
MSLLNTLVAKKCVHLWAYERNIIHFGGVMIRGDLAKAASHDALISYHDIDSDTVVWWRCANWSCFITHDHQMSIREKLTSDEWRCPNCVRFKKTPGKLSSVPEIDGYWNWDLNDNKQMHIVTPGAGVSKGLFHFRCMYGHPTLREANWFNSGRTCRFCRGTEPWPGFNTFDLVKDASIWWDHVANLMLGVRITDITHGSQEEAWFKCPAFGHSFKMICKNFKAGNRCPYCATQKKLPGFNTLDTYKKILPYWDDNLNILPLHMIAKKSTITTIMLRCTNPNCRLVWPTTPANFVSGRRCTVCGRKNYAKGGKYLSSFPGILDKWDWTRNNANGVKPDKIGKYSRVNIHMICDKNHNYITTPVLHTSGGGCGECGLKNQSRAAVEWMSTISKRYNINIRRKPQNIEFKIPGTGYFADGYACIGDREIIFEFHGTFWHGHKDFYDPDDTNPINGKRFGDIYNDTLTKEHTIRQLGYVLIVIWEHDYKKIRNDVLRGEINVPELDTLLE